MIADDFDVDAVIEKLVSMRFYASGTSAELPESTLIGVARKAQDIFLGQPVMLNLGLPVKIVGDIHGQFYDLLRIFEYCGYPPEANYLFLGDYVDRGLQSIEVITLLLCYKLKYPENVFLIRGNHEVETINHAYDFYTECSNRYSANIWKVFNETFNCLPYAAIIEDRIFCCHGGLSPELTKVSQIKEIDRFRQLPDSDMIRDILWSDPAQQVEQWKPNDKRNTSYTFNATVVENFLTTNNLDLMCRGHQAVNDGYEFFAKRRFVTIFSAPKYCGSFNNCGAVMAVDNSLICSFQVLRPYSGTVKRDFV